MTYNASSGKKRVLYGRRQGRSLSPSRLRIMEDVLPKVEIQDSALTQDHTLPPEKLFNQPFSEYWLEIGFGHGERLAEQARQAPDKAFIGAEPFINGVASFMKDVQNDTADNIRILVDDGMFIASSLKKNSISGLYILNPDPWHKKRHYKRRIINQENLDIFAKILKPGSPLIMTTDVEDLADWMCIQASNHPDFTWTATQKADWDIPPSDWISTKYETKRAKGAKKMIYLFFRKK